MIWRLNELGVDRHQFAIRIACDIDARQISITIEEDVELDAARSINEVKSQGKHASPTTISRYQGLKSGSTLNFDVIAVTAAIADSRDGTGGELLEKPLASRYVASPSKKFRPAPSCCGVIHLYSPKQPMAGGRQSPLTENVSLRRLG
jgi:hypothetical protein